DPFLDHFRDSWVVAGMTRRATAGSAHPNLAGALLAAGLVTAAALLAWRAERRRSSWRITAAGILPLAGLLSLGLLSTYSRGGLLAAGVGLLTLAGGLALRRPALAASPLGALVAVGAAAALAASTDPVLGLRLTAPTHTWYDARYETLSAPAALGPGTAGHAAVRVTNTGQRTWSRASGIRIGYRLLDRTGAPVAVAFGPGLPHDLRSGESAVFEMRVEAPPDRRSHVLVWDMAQPGVDWFSRLGARPGVVSVSEGGPAAAGAGQTPPIWRPSRMEIWPLALAMWREHPVLGVGPDNFRKLAGRYAGRTAEWDPRTHANNTGLEVAATVGAVGFFALLGVFLGTFAACGRALRRADPHATLAAACLALAATTLAHGLVDHVLAFTGHYLLLAFTAGAASALAMEEPPVA
ncbi:MAG TPA: O-antigen ligase family protein, partial [Vicinamibacteria bacterium]|nr:O-antigen ligase family protein [Vicinamibacteria bacterium]